jgi:hypothetical protein
VVVRVTGKNWIMIYGPKDDGTYVVEFRTAWDRAGDFNPEERGGRDPVFPGANARWVPDDPSAVPWPFLTRWKSRK